MRGGMRLAEAQVGWRVGDWVAAGVRAVAVLVLGVGLASAIVAENPPTRSTQELIDDLDAGRVRYVEYQSSWSTIRWSTGWWQWRETQAPPVEASGEAPDQQAQQWLRQQINASGHDVPVRTRGREPRFWWQSQVPDQPLQALTLAAWIGTLLVMLATREHRYANRWAWFWLITFGQVGVLLYLLFEPRPLWRPRAWDAQVDRRQPMGGGMGCAWSILLPCMLGILAIAITELLDAIV